MRSSLGFAVPSVVATLSTVLLCSGSGNVATHTELLASRRLGRSAEGKTDCCCSEAGAKDRDLPPPDIRLIIRSNAVVRAGFTNGEACQAGESSPQLQRWLRNKFPGRQRPLGRM